VIPEVRVEREIAAPLEVVFDAFTSAGGQEALYGPASTARSRPACAARGCS